MSQISFKEASEEQQKTSVYFYLNAGCDIIMLFHLTAAEQKTKKKKKEMKKKTKEAAVVDHNETKDGRVLAAGL